MPGGIKLNNLVRFLAGIAFRNPRLSTHQCGFTHSLRRDNQVLYLSTWTGSSVDFGISLANGPSFYNSTSPPTNLPNSYYSIHLFVCVFILFEN